MCRAPGKFLSTTFITSASYTPHSLKGDGNRHSPPLLVSYGSCYPIHVAAHPLCQHTCNFDDYAQVLAQLVEYWEWDIDAYRSYLRYTNVTICIAFIPTSPIQPKHSHRQHFCSAICTRLPHYGRVDALALQWVDPRGVPGTYLYHRSPHLCYPRCIPRLGPSPSDGLLSVSVREFR